MSTRLHDDIAAWAAEHAGTDLDLDKDLEQAGLDALATVDIAPGPAEILALAAASLADVPAAELRSLTRRLQEPES